MNLYVQSCNHTIELRYTATLSYVHVPYRDHISLQRMYVYYAENSTTESANFTHQVVYIYMSQSVEVMITNWRSQTMYPSWDLKGAHRVSMLTITLTEININDNTKGKSVGIRGVYLYPLKYRGHNFCEEWTRAPLCSAYCLQDASTNMSAV